GILAAPDLFQAAVLVCGELLNRATLQRFLDFASMRHARHCHSLHSCDRHFYPTGETEWCSIRCRRVRSSSRRWKRQEMKMDPEPLASRQPITREPNATSLNQQNPVFVQYGISRSGSDSRPSAFTICLAIFRRVLNQAAS